MATAHAPAQLVELRQTETVWLVDDHEVCCRDVHADLDDGCCDENLDFSGGKALDDFVSFGVVHLAVDAGDFEFCDVRVGVSHGGNESLHLVYDVIDAAGA